MVHRKRFWTPLGARLEWVRSSGNVDLHWLFLPGGPGLGSESLLPLLDILELPGTMWRLDLPGDGSNTTGNNVESFSHWSAALIEAVSEWEHVVLVAHSTGGMYALATPELQNLLTGLVLLDSAPDSKWHASFAEEMRASSNETLKELTIASAPYLFTETGLDRGVEMLRALPYNYEVCEWSAAHFDGMYEAKWIPEAIPTLILAGERDLITPLRFFLETKSFRRENITFRSIPNGGHFPWIENPEQVSAAFTQFAQRLLAHPSDEHVQ